MAVLGRFVNGLKSKFLITAHQKPETIPSRPNLLSMI